jgi:hypothetical protein
MSSFLSYVSRFRFKGPAFRGLGFQMKLIDWKAERLEGFIVHELPNFLASQLKAMTYLPDTWFYGIV